MTEQAAVPTPAALPRPAVSPAVRFGRIDDDGRAFVQTPDGDICVGQWAAGTTQEGLAFFARKYDDLIAEADLTERRLAEGYGAPEAALVVADRIDAVVREPNCIGDLTTLAERSSALRALAKQARERRAAERAQAKAAAQERRTALATEAETLASSTTWRATTERFAQMVEEWKALPRGDRSVDQALWKQFSTARSAFDKRRRAHFAEREAQRKEALTAKRALIAKAESLSTSTDWAGTTKALKGLSEEWRRAPRAGRADEDKLWRRFKAAQDAFFAARTAADEAREADLVVNVAPKEALAAEAEALLPVTDPKQARSALRDIQRRWDALGDVPRAARSSLERRLAKVEDQVRAAEQSAWRSTNPEGLARAESAVSAFDGALAKLQDKHAACVAAGDQAGAERIAADIDQTEALKAAALKAATDFR
jgi:hypothetical protein